ncbi:hypothetical protein SNE40_019120 [Patella caerulea]|uniref:Fibrinogen C-terminal domain-containing protein n=1 Tax=Patella caerulea TaxID=87958 RepID=A0AAN8P9P5_PATCE
MTHTILLVQVLTLMFLILVQSLSYRYGSYIKSNVVINSCDPSRFIETTYTSRKFDCSRTCTEKTDCKRYLYCSLDSSCKLYQDGKDCVISEDKTGCSCYVKSIGCEDSVCTCPLGRYGDRCQDILIDCQEGYNKGWRYPMDVLTNIKPVNSPDSFEVLCTFGYGGWTVMFHRNPDCSFENYNRTLIEYEEGFGNVASNKWLGFIKLLYILGHPSSTHKLGVLLYKPDSSYCVNHYYNFAISNKSTSYKISISGNGALACGDSLTGTINLNNNPFSTYDADYTGNNECAKRFGGGWWFDSQVNCTNSFLTGTMDSSGIDNFWHHSLSDTPPKEIFFKLQRN